MNNSKTILCVDDDTSSRLLLRKILGRMDCCNVIDAVDGKSCLDVLSNTHVDLVILDYMLGDMTGLEVCKALGDDHPNASTPVIISSIINSREIKKLNSCRNVIKIVQKPYAMDELKQDVMEIFGAQQ